MDIGRFVDRRLHPVRLVVDVLRDQLEHAEERVVSLDRERMVHLVETLALFVEDFEISHRAQRESAARTSPRGRPNERAERAEEA